MAPTTLLLSPSELSYLHTSLALDPPLRPDGRSPTSFRPLIAETDLVPSAYGSARLCFADGTEAICGVKAEVERTDGARQGRDLDSNLGREVRGEKGDAGKERDGSGGSDEEMGGVEIEHAAKGGEDEEIRDKRRGDNGWIEVSVDMPGLQRDDDAVVIFLAQMIHEGLVTDGMLSKRLYINEGWHWRIYIDILLLSPPLSYPLPLLSLTTHLALLTTRLPAPISLEEEDPLFNDDWDAALPLYPDTTTHSKGKVSSSSSTRRIRPSVTLLVISVGSNIFFDPSREELAVADAVVAITIGGGDSGTEKGDALSVLAVRSIDPPSRLSSSSAVMDAEIAETEGDEEGVWRPRRGGVGRKVLARMVGMCVAEQGVGEEVLRGLEEFT